MNVLPELQIHSRKSIHMHFNGIDSAEHCDDQDWFLNFPHTVSYQYNSRGFRDAEWPPAVQDLKNAIWCLGDSFTVGVGSPLAHTWVNMLQSKRQQRVINISMDGASNQWIARRALDVIEQINPHNIIIMWSYLHRRETGDHTQTDEDRRVWSIDSDPAQDLEVLKNCVSGLAHHAGIQHYIIPRASHYEHWLDIWDQVAGPDWPGIPTTVDEFLNLPRLILIELKKFGVYKKIHTAVLANQDFKIFCKDQHIQRVQVLDLARDGHHFDKDTSDLITDAMITQLT